MLTKRQFFLTAATLLACFLALNLVVAYLTRNSVPRRIMRHARESRSASVIAIGNSLVAAGFDEVAFDEGAGLRPPHGGANIGLGASSTVEQLLLLRYSLSQGMRPRLLIYGFYDFQLTEPNRFASSDLMGNRAMLYYVEPFYARRFYSLSLHDSLQFDAMRSFPMFADRGAIWAKIELLRRAIAQQGMPPQLTNRFGRAADFSLLESDNAEDFHRKCKASLEQPLSPAVSEIFRVAQKAGIAIAVVAMPMRAAHRNLFYDTMWWNQYMRHVRTLVSPYSVTIVDASQWLTDDSLFADPLHLSEQGAAKFSRELGDLLGPGLAHFSTNNYGSEIGPTKILP